jgi:hypothetical protein
LLIPVVPLGAGIVWPVTLLFVPAVAFGAPGEGAFAF